ncbi:MAG: 4-hydroxythreonine-4-phosphate dehydrogenase PdxA [bacterium]
MNQRFKIAITQGDINGIGYEVILKALADQHILDYCTPIIYGSVKAASYHKKTLNIDSYTITVAKSADEVKPKKISIINTSDEEYKINLGEAAPEAGKAAFEALEAATADLLAGKVDAIVTAPINKASIQNDKFKFAGHTEYFESKANGKSLMILASDTLRVALATNHLPVTEVPQAITTEGIIEKLELLDKSMKEDFNIIKPRIAVLALNPHAGDDGLLGSEEKEIIKPAINAAIEKGIVCVGPLAADGFFGSTNFKHYDAVLAMYHDQGLAAFKALTTDNGVNITAGLDIVRTSPAHGTGYDIAGKGIANELSMREAIYSAIHIVKNRNTYKEIYANPLPFPKPDERRPVRDRGGFNPRKPNG